MRNLRESFSRIYDDYVDKIYRFIYLKVNSHEIAEDLTAEAFLRCWESFKDNKAKIKNLNAFLYKIARNLVTDHYREKGRTQFVSTDCLPITDLSSDPKEESLMKSDFETIKTAMNNLKGNYQEILIWHYLEDLSIAEIAEMLNKSEGAVRVMVHRALKALKNKLEES